MSFNLAYREKLDFANKKYSEKYNYPEICDGSVNQNLWAMDIRTKLLIDLEKRGKLSKDYASKGLYEKIRFIDECVWWISHKDCSSEELANEILSVCADSVENDVVDENDDLTIIDLSEENAITIRAKHSDKLYKLLQLFDFSVVNDGYRLKLLKTDIDRGAIITKITLQLVNRGFVVKEINNSHKIDKRKIADGEIVLENGSIFCYARNEAVYKSFKRLGVRKIKILPENYEACFNMIKNYDLFVEENAKNVLLSGVKE